ncbi:ParA family protein [uncultured Fusobacterium sp.]|uniref:ParA family protein n=1 Tax=uncultured Fusobacterium sp. TaxID=159267 RepID=UPI0015A68300|nr:ParA family protein [uncultured Fusobacterium sp.]
MKIINKNLALAYKKRNDKDVLNKAKLKFDKEMMEFFPLTSENGDLIFSYENKTIELRKGTSEQVIELKKENKIEKMVKNISLIWERIKGDYYTPLISVPLGVVRDMGINRENKEVEIFFNEGEYKSFIINVKEDRMKTVPITLTNGEIKELETKYLEEIEFQPKSHIKFLKRNGSVITIKVGKGGVGKTFLTTQIATGLAEFGLKVLIITSDPQNDVIKMCYPKGKYPSYQSGLNEWVVKGNGDFVKLRPNVDFIPLENAKFTEEFEKKFPEFISNMRNKYDYILIDSMPVMTIDEIYHKETDKVIIPLFGDELTIDGAIKVMLEIGLEKVLAVIFNRYDNTKEQKINYEEVEKAVEGSNVLMVNPIKRMSYIQTMLAHGKNVWDNKKIVKNPDGSESRVYGPKQLDEVRDSLMKVIQKTIMETYKEPEEITIDL